MSAFDIFALAILSAAILRGLWIGLVAEALSLTALGASVIAARIWTEPLAHWLQSPSGLSVRYDLARWMAGVLVFTGVLIAVVAFGRMMRENPQAAARGRLDRIGGAVLGMAEGALAAGLLIFAMGAWLGRDHEALAGSRSLALIELTEPTDSAPVQWVTVDPSSVSPAGPSRPIPTTPPVAAGPVPRPYVPPSDGRGPGASTFLTVLALLGGLALFTWNRWTSDVVVYTVTDLPKEVRPSQVRWISSSEPGDRVRVGPLQRQEWHLVDRAKSTHLVLAWKGND